MRTNSTTDPVMENVMKASGVSSDLIWSGEERKNNTSGATSDVFSSKRENSKQSIKDKSLRWTNFDHRVQAMKQGVHKRNGT